MSNILEGLFYGNLRPDECIHPNNPEYLLLTRKISSAMEAYKKQLSTDEFDSLEKLVDLLGESTSIYSAASFVHGFRMGALMMVEVYGGGEDFVQRKT
ncbi:DUF6809 family protein [Paenibacillus durus]|uniref:Uncharacterized protein n=1 Tax=Paenibacillus durus ATCC 35681 TaxID=1333534 RepID=A0A0F7FA37_PAEDU|nr:DUF6809 family protein [Paenibacillus durus]AKG34872.1 hypothetical protein VK70_10085 [Paenibacillus durus ATCC 35681]